ncbi:MAG: DUF3108 domain-containing protein [Pseudomonadota bacterium]
MGDKLRYSFRRYLTRCIFLTALFLGTLATITFIIKSPIFASDLQRLNATYSINFNDFELGTFKLWSEMSNNRYSVLGKGELSILQGIFFSWKATIKSSGKITKRGPKPKSFSFHYESNSQQEKVNVLFRKERVNQVIYDPPFVPKGNIAPISQKHLKKVFDPMSAMIALTSSKNNRKGSGSKICKITLPLFDGKERYNLVFSHKKTVHMSKTNEKGYSGPAHICRVRYHPIAGHEKDNQGTQFMADTKEIEVWMVPVPNTSFNLPYHIVIPTLVGYVSATSQMFQVEKPNGEIAFVN